MDTSIMLVVITFISSVVGTISGFGISTIMIPALASAYPLQENLLFVAIIHAASDIWKLLLFHVGIRWRLILYFGSASFVATILGALLSARVGSSPIFVQVLGAFLIFYALLLLIRPSFTIKQTPQTMIQGGAASGFTFGLFGMGGVMRSMVLIAFNFDKIVYLATDGALAFIVDVTRIIVYVLSGFSLGAELKDGLIFCVPISFVGAKVGEKIVYAIPQKKFRLVVAGFILVLGVKLMIVA